MLGFQKLAFMFIDISMVHLVFLFTEGLDEPLKVFVKYHNPSTLKYAMNLTRDLQNVLSKTRSPPKPNFPSKLKYVKKPWKKDSFGKDKKHGPSKEDFNRNNLCFTCHQPWVLGHKCAKGKAHYFEFFFENDEEGEEEAQQLAS